MQDSKDKLVKLGMFTIFGIGCYLLRAQAFRARLGRTLPQPTKSNSDQRTYRTIVLPNGLQVLLVSDPSAVKSAAALCVRVGHFSDPDDVPGLAHFTEHMLHLGTDRYPDEAYYKKYLARHGGYYVL